MLTPDSELELIPSHVIAARRGIAPYLRHTPLEPNASLSKLAGFPVLLKLENLQVTGSFKPRGSLHKVLSVRASRPDAEFIAPTAGGHGIGLAYAAATLGAKAHIYLPRSADPDKLRMIQEYGAHLEYFDNVPLAREAARRVAAERGYTFLSAYNDRHMMEGGGTVALEILEDCPQVETVLVGVGGGGLLAGMSVVLKAANPRIRLIGVQPETSAVLAQWHREGQPVDVPDVRPSIAEGIGAQVEKELLPWPYLKRNVDEFVLVTDDELREAMRWCVSDAKYILEPSAAAGLAALRKLLPRALGPTVVVLTGRNVSWHRFEELVRG
ncbi:pyridoxal-phosphate dependent enzyme [Archangium violaceum]|uniref:threonine ammonia-lyase n=1 Tax=Archangium violaceum TaxID=83451 RepID=UPI002B282A0F|nr:pyridoxal-phosphate dependent enzyme [Archangium gephyra]